MKLGTLIDNVAFRDEMFRQIWPLPQDICCCLPRLERKRSEYVLCLCSHRINQGIYLHFFTLLCKQWCDSISGKPLFPVRPCFRLGKVKLLRRSELCHGDAHFRSRNNSRFFFSVFYSVFASDTMSCSSPINYTSRQVFIKQCASLYWTPIEHTSVASPVIHSNPEPLPYCAPAQ